MISTAALFLALTYQSGPSYKIGGDTVPVQIPTWTAPAPMDTFELNGWKYGFSHGNLVSKGRKGFNWEDVPSAGAIQGAAKQRVLVNLVTRIDTMSDRGFLWQRQATLFNDDFRAIKREVALFCYLVSSLSEGKTEIQPSWRVDDTLRFVDQPEDLGARYLETFINATDVKPAEGLGPFDSVIVLNPSFGRTVAFGSLDRASTASIPIYSYFDRARPGQLARAMYNAWLAAPIGGRMTLADPVGSGPFPLENLADWQSAGWQKLPLEASGFVPAGAGAQAASVLLTTGLFVRPAFAELYASKLGRAPVAQNSGWVVFDAKGLSEGQTDAQRLGIVPKIADQEVGSPDLAFTPGQAEQLPVSGSFAAKTFADPDRGSVGEIRELAIRRQGWVRLLSPFDGTSAGVLEFWLKPRGTVWPVNLLVVGDGTTQVFRLFGSGTAIPGIEPRYSEADAVELDVKAEPTWQRIAIKHTIHAVEGVYLASPAYADGEEIGRSGLPSLLIDDLSAKPNVTGDLTPKKASVPTELAPVFDRAHDAITTTDVGNLVKLLSDPSDVVQLNAASRFIAIKSADAVPGLTLIARNYNPRLAYYGARALAFQGTDTAIGALRYNYQNALGDFVKQFSADAMPAVNERKILSELALALNARRPEARASAARAIARQPFKEASMVLLSFLSDVEPVVRAATIDSLPEKQPAAFQRVLGFARNDPSDFVRAAAFRKLKEWGAPEAAEVSKDPSPRVQAAH